MRKIVSPLDGFGSPFNALSSFSPAMLFRQAEVGVWYDPSDLSTMFQDSAGTTPVTAVEQPVGLLLDKSKGLALGSELVTNGSFATDTDWTKGTGWTIASGVATRTATGAQSFLEETASVVNGSWYNVTFTVTALTAGDIGIRLGSNAIANHITATAIGTYTGTVQCGGTDGKIYMRASSGFAGSIDNISVKLISGNHASQSTAASRPVLSARVNLLTYTEQFDNAVWAKGATTVTPDTTVAPDGATTADTVTEANSAAFIRTSVTIASGVTYKFRICIKRGNFDWVRLSFGNDLSVTNGFSTWYNVNTGAVGSSATYGTGWSVSAFTCSATSNGFYILDATFVGSGTSLVIYTVSASANSSLTLADVGSGAGVNTVRYQWGADLRAANAGVNLPAYQRVVQGIPTTTNPAVTGTADYDTVGFPTYLRFDGVDDSLATSTISPGSVDKAQVFAGVRKLSDAAANTVVELSASGTSNAGTFTLFAGSAASTYYFRSRGSNVITGALTPASYASPITNVLTGIGDIAADVSAIRVNGVDAGLDGSDQGTGNFGAYPLYIGSRGGSTVRFNGNLYSFLVRFSSANLDAATISKTETWVNSKTSAY